MSSTATCRPSISSNGVMAGSLSPWRDLHYGRSGNPGPRPWSRDVGRDQGLCPRNAPTGSFDWPRPSGSVALVSDPWTFSGKVAGLDQASGVVTLVDESTFAISGLAGRRGHALGAQGLFVRDTRILSRFELRVNGARPESLAAVTDDPFSATFVSRCPPRPGVGRLHPDGLPASLRGPGHARGPHHPQLRRRAHVLLGGAVRRLRLRRPLRRERGPVRRSRRGDHPRAARDRTARRSHTGGAPSTGGWPSTSSPTPSQVADDLVTFEAIVPAHGEWNGLYGGPPRHRGQGHRPPLSVRPARRPGRPGRAPGQVATPGAAGRDRPRGAARRHRPSAEDLGALRIFDPDFPSGWWWPPARRGS